MALAGQSEISRTQFFKDSVLVGSLSRRLLIPSQISFQIRKKFSYLWAVVYFADQEVCAFFVNCPPLSSSSERSQLRCGGIANLPVSQRCPGLLGSNAKYIAN